MDREVSPCAQVAGIEEQGERADAVEIAVVAFIADPVEEFPGIALGGAGPEQLFPRGGGLEQSRRDVEGMLKARTKMAAVDADNDSRGLTGGYGIQEAAEGAAEPVKVGQVIPFAQAFDVLVHAAAEKRDEANRLLLFNAKGRRMKLMKRLEPDQGELDGMFAIVRLGKEVMGGVGFGGEGVDQLGRAEGVAQRRMVIAVVEIPFEVGAMADAEDDVDVGEGFGQERLKCGGVGPQADAEIDMGCDDAQKRAFGGCRWQLIRGKGAEGVPEKCQRLGGIGRITGRVMLGG